MRIREYSSQKHVRFFRVCGKFIQDKHEEEEREIMFRIKPECIQDKHGIITSEGIENLKDVLRNNLSKLSANKTKSRLFDFVWCMQINHQFVTRGVFTIVAINLCYRLCQEHIQGQHDNLPCYHLLGEETHQHMLFLAVLFPIDM